MNMRPVPRLLCWSVFLAVVGMDALLSARVSLGTLYLLPLALAALWLGPWDVTGLVVASALAQLFLGGAGEALGLAASSPELEPAAPAHALLAWLGSCAAYAALALVLLRLREQSRRLERLGNGEERDPLTGLGNRRALARFLQEERGRQVALLLLDVDFFKKVNDTHGYSAGDGVLRELAGRLVAVVRAQDHVVRVAGEEFAVMLQGADSATAREVADRLLRKVRAQPFALEAGGVALLTASIGLATGPASETLLQEADHALYLAKVHGHNRLEEALYPRRAGIVRAARAR